jgi:hypothetical protein
MATRVSSQRHTPVLFTSPPPAQHMHFRGSLFVLTSHIFLGNGHEFSPLPNIRSFSFLRVIDALVGRFRASRTLMISFRPCMVCILLSPDEETLRNVAFSLSPIPHILAPMSINNNRSNTPIRSSHIAIWGLARSGPRYRAHVAATRTPRTDRARLPLPLPVPGLHCAPPDQPTSTSTDRHPLPPSSKPRLSHWAMMALR